MQIQNIRMRLGRAYAAVNYGYGVIGWIISLLGWTSVIGLVLMKYIPTWLVYFSIPMIVVSIAFIVGYIFKKHGIWENQNGVGAEMNPYLGRILGQKEYLSYVQHVQGMNLIYETTKLQLRWFKEDLHYDTGQAEKSLANYMSLIEYYEKLVAEAQVDNETRKTIEGKKVV